MGIGRIIRWPGYRLLPRTLAAWVLILLVGVLLASQTSLFWIVSRDRSASNEIVDLYRLNERAYWLAKLMAPISPEERAHIGTELADSTIVINLSALPAVGAPVASTDTLAELEDIIFARLSKFGVQDARVRLDDPGQPEMQSLPATEPSADTGDVEEDLTEIASDFLKSQRYTVSLKLKDGQWLNFVTPVTPIAPLLAPESLPKYLLVSGIVLALAFWGVWRIAAPYQLLEGALARLGEDLNSLPIPEEGGRDLRRAAKAVNRTQASLQATFEERELLAAALAHDLRTPVTRMRLRLALLGRSASKAALESDIADIEETVESVIDLARLGSSSEPSELIDLWSMVDAIAEEYPEASLAAKPASGARLICSAPPIVMRRAVRNLVENAIKYAGEARLSIDADEELIVLRVADNGQGIPKEELDRVFRPFVRLEQSRNRDTGGSGLGLTIARSLIRKIGGDIVLRNHDAGGLEAILSVPRARSRPQS
jgi:signal transduction histidine kinase